MYLVALTRWGPVDRPPGPAEPELIAAEVAALGPFIGMGPYELRLLLSSPLPILLLETDDSSLARTLLASVRSRGHGAVACDARSVSSSAGMLQPKSFRLESDALWLEAPGAPALEKRHSDVLSLIVATHGREEESSREIREKKLSLGRAALTGGLVRSKTKTSTETASIRESERVLYLLDRSGTGHALLRETRLHYTGLGSRMGKSAAESFSTLLAVLRERIPDARYDDRLLKQRAGRSLAVSRTSASRTVSTSNEAEVDRAAHLLAVAFLQAQA